MKRRFVSIWFRHLLTDHLIRQQPELQKIPFVITEMSKGRLVVVAANDVAEKSGVYPGMVMADARTLEPQLINIDHKPDLAAKLLKAIGEYCTRYTPYVAVDLPDGIYLDTTGCAHLWGGEAGYLKEIITRLRSKGYDARGAMADTIGAAWAVSRYGTERPLIPVGECKPAIKGLPPDALRLDSKSVARLKKLGFRRVSQIIDLPRSSLIRRFGKEISLRLDQALGNIEEKIVFLRHIDPYVEDLPTPEGVATAEGIAAALGILLDRLCKRLHDEHKGVRTLVFDGFRVDSKVETIEIGTSRPSRSSKHLFKLFQDKLDKIEPALGIEQFRLSATKVEDIAQSQNVLLDQAGSFDDNDIKEMIDRLSNKYSEDRINCVIPQERHWPERSIKAVSFSDAQIEAKWQETQLRPIRLLRRPEPIEVTAPVPDYPPMFFRHGGRLHRVKKADGPERIECEWWFNKEEPRDYFKLEDENGQRFWVYRRGGYSPENPAHWFLHGYFA